MFCYWCRLSFNKRAFWVCRYALGIGLGGTVEAHTNAGGTEPLRGLRGALYLGCGMAVLGILIVVLFVRVPKDNREGYDDKREVLEKIAV